MLKLLDMDVARVFPVICFIAFLCGTKGAYGHGDVPGAASMNKRSIPGPCHQDSDCPGTGSKCFFDYAGCREGLCGCRYGTAHDGSCLFDVTRTNTRCSVDNRCSPGFVCSDKFCHWTGKFSNSLGRNDKYLGESCRPGTDTCHRLADNKIGFVSHGATCIRGTCTCTSGRIQDGRSCRRVRIGEKGCLSMTDCGGDSMCQAGVCRCPSGYREVVRDKCGKINARTKIKERNICDETREKDRFCAQGLHCVRCGNQNFRCWKATQIRPFSSGSPLDRPNLLTVVVTALTSVLFKYYTAFR